MRPEIGRDGLTVSHLLWRMGHLFSGKKYWTVDDRQNMVCRTYGDLLAMSAQYAAVLTQAAPQPGACIATLAWNHDRHLGVILATSAVGDVVVPLNPRSSVEHLHHVLAKVPISVLVFDADLAELAHSLRAHAGGEMTLLRSGAAAPDCDCPGLDELATSQPTSFDWPTLDENQPMLVSYTSGTTGMPKGVVYSHRSQMLHAMMALGADTLGVREADVVLPAAAFFHANSQGLPYASLLAGASMVLPGRRAGDGPFLAELVESYKVTCFGAVPTVVHRVAEALRSAGTPTPLAGTRMISGGSAVDRALVDRVADLGGQMIQVWGMTETSPIAAVSRPRSWLDPESSRHSQSAQGVPVAGVEFELRDLETREPVEWNGRSTGELNCRGPWIINDYLWGAWQGESHDWLGTGDVASIDESGYMRIVDRLKDLVKSGGEWIATRRLEEAILQVDGVTECAVVGIPHPEWGERPVAYVVARESADVESLGARIRSALVGSVPKFWLPDDVRVLERLPRTPNEKIDKMALRRATDVPPADRTTGSADGQVAPTTS
ncbi:AMP-binding protein [Streptosporangium sp. NBC_01755]|uniref:AMP-binding protein n=1 Tax=Streptosporangium sp. NBC_01755 TaxID=2975949 RepID=UPI002DDAC709|nr:AMP-binding protein [Streptosporangium sp. NBC_01755]WSC97188.1 AMP-binding protein [Streptosporangium sp. NBC_01755]